jgi:hypothetical protein
MIMRCRPILFRLVLLVAVIAGLWWLFHVPYVPRLMFKPIPSGAVFVTQHRELARRWDSIYRNPLALSLLSSAGVKRSALKDLADDPQVRPWFEKLASRDTVLAYVPAMGPDREPVWVMTSWLGGRSQRLRWQLGWSKLEGFTQAPAHRGRTYWIVDDEMLSSENTLTLALVEGMLIGCISWRHETMRDVLDTLDGMRPSVLQRTGFPNQVAWLDDEQTMDRGWLDAAALMGWRGPAAKPFAYEFTEISPTTFVGRMQWDHAPKSFPSGWDETRKASLSALLGETPIAVCAVSSDWLPASLDGAQAGFLYSVAREIVREQGAEGVAVALLGGEYGGRLLGIRVPSVLLAIPLQDAGAVPARMQRMLDRLNARNRWGLIPHRLDIGAGEITILEGTAGTLYARLPLQDKPAYAVKGDWLLFASNADALANVLRRETGVSDAPPCWSADSDVAATPLYLWADFMRGSQTLRLAISAYSLKLLVEDARGTMEQRQRLNEIRAWLDVLEPLGQFAVRAEPRGEDTTVHFRIGRICEP